MLTPGGRHFIPEKPRHQNYFAKPLQKTGTRVGIPPGGEPSRPNGRDARCKSAIIREMTSGVRESATAP